MAFNESINYNGPFSSGDEGSEDLMNAAFTQFGSLSNRMTAGNRGVLYIVTASGTDRGRVYIDNGTSWISAGWLLDRRVIVSTAVPTAGNWTNGDIWITREV